MQLCFVILVLLPVAFSAAVGSETVDLRIHKSGSVTVNSTRLSALVTLRCRTGPEEDGFEVEISPNDGAKITEANLEGSVKPTEPPSESGGRTIAGKLLDLNLQQTKERCEAAPHEKECSRVYSGAVNIREEKLVPGSITPLAWIARFRVNFQCLISPVDPEDDDTKPNVPGLVLEQCEQFHHSFHVHAHPLPDNCIISIAFSSPVANRGYGYKLQKCALTRAGAAAIPLILNGRTQKTAQTEVTARPVDGGSGKAFQVAIRGMTAEEVKTYKLSCEIERCRGSVLVNAGSVPQCTQAPLLTDFAIVDGRGSSPVVDVSGSAGSPMQGEVKLYIAAGAAGKSSAPNVQECLFR